MKVIPSQSPNSWYEKQKTLSSGICNPRGTNLRIFYPRGSQTRSYTPVDCKSTGTKEQSVFCIIVFCSRGFAIPESLICGYSICAGRRPAINSPVDCKSTGTSVVPVSILPAFSKKACRKLKMFSVKNEPRPSERSEGVWRV